MQRDLYAEVTSRIIAKLESGAAPWVRGWSAGTSIPMNAISNRPYSGINVLVFWLSQDAGYAKPRYLTFKQAKEAGGTVRAGQHGTKIYFFKQLEIRDKESDEEKTIPMLREYTVFNVDQCDNLPDRVKYGPHGALISNPDSREETADAFIRSTGADFREGAGKPCYVPSKDFITVPAWSQFKSRPDFYADSFHELTHWTGHKSRLDRDLKNRFGTREYAAEELIAEIGAAFLCAEFGFDTVDNSAAYLTSWLELLKSDKRAIFTAASNAQKAADYLRGLALADKPQAIAA